MKKYQLLLALVALTGCASTGPSIKGTTAKNEDTVRSEMYLQNLSATPVASTGDSCSATKSENWKTLVSKASACARTGQWTLVEDFAYQISKLDMNSPWGLYFYSLAAEAKKDYPRALWMIEAALKKGPRVALFHYQKGRLMWADKPSESALKEIEMAAKADPNFLDAHVFLGDARLRSWELSQAENHFSAALKIKSNYYEAVRGMADVKRLKGDLKESIPLLSQAASLKPTDLSTRVYLATAYEEVKQPSDALSTYRSLRESLNSGLIKEKPDFDVNEKIRSLESMIAANEAKAKATTAKANAEPLVRNPAQKGVKK